MRVIRLLIKLLLFLLLLVVIGVAALFFIIDSDKIKQTIADKVQAETGMVLAFDGDTSMTFFPKLGVHAENLTLYQADGSTRVAGLESANVAVALQPLFSRRIEADAIRIEGLFARYEVNADGSSNIDPLLNRANNNADTASDNTPANQNTADTSQSETSQASESSGWSINEISVPSVTIEQSVIEYLNQAENQALSVGINTLTLDQIDFSGKSVRVAVDALIDQQSAEHVVMGQSLLTYRSEMDQWLLESNDWALESTLHPLLSQGVELMTPRILWQNQNKTLQVQEIQLNAGDLSAEGEFYAELADNVSWNANLQTNRFALSALGEALPAGAGQYASSQFGIRGVDIVGNSQRVRLNNIQASLDDTNITGNLSLPLGSGVTELNLALDQLNLNRYLANTGTSNAGDSGSQQNASVANTNNANAPNPSTAARSAASQKAILPTQTLRDLRLNGSVTIDALTYDAYELENIRCDLAPGNSQRNVFNCNLASGQYPISARVAAFVGNATPLVGADLQIAGVDLADVLANTKAAGLVSGSIDGNVELKANGESLNAWLNTLDGPFNFMLDQPVLNGVNINNLIVDAIGASQIDQLGAVLDLTGNRLPRELSENTELVDTRIQGRVESGVVRLNNLNLATINGDAISGGGTIRLSDLKTNLRFTVKLRALQRHEFLSDFEWPIVCQGRLGSQPLGQLCGGAVGNLQTIVTEVLKRRARQEVEDLARSEIEKLTGNQLGEGNIEDALRDEARNQLQKQQDNLQDQLEKRLGDEAGNLLRGLFGN